MHVSRDAFHQKLFGNIDVCCILFAFAGQVRSCLIDDFALFSSLVSDSLARTVDLLFFSYQLHCLLFQSLKGENTSQASDTHGPTC